MSLKKIDKSFLLFMLLGGFVIYKTQAMNIGSFSDPGPGFFPFILGVLLIAVSSVSLVTAGTAERPEAVEKTDPKSVIYIVIALLGFRLCLPVLGFSSTTFLLFVLMLKVLGKRTWGITILYSCLFTGACLILFIKCLGVQFPRGILPY